MANAACHICGTGALEFVHGYERLRRVTSDCKPWPAGGRLAVCRTCGCAQAAVDASWHEEAKRIYGSYSIYHQAQGAEQSVFDQTSGHATARSDQLLSRLHKEVCLPSTGRLLDIGCGNGALLRAFNRRWPSWSMVGLEVSGQYKSVVENIPGVEALLTCPPEGAPGRFQLISLVHVLEHIASPRPFLSTLRDKIEPGGMLLVEVPDCEENPFMLLVADHATHFFCVRLRNLVESAGFEIVAASTGWVSKEISLVAKKREIEPHGHLRTEASDHGVAELVRRVHWLQLIVENCRSLRNGGPFGVFGTSIAGTWLFAELNGEIDFFVDEDPNRIGQSHFGRPILAPRQVPGRSQIFIALPPVLASAVAGRLENIPAEFHVPPLLQ